MKGMNFALLIAWMLPLLGAAQVKFEREYRVSAKEVPAPARDFAGQAFPGQKIKWYKEERLASVSFEAKTARFSVEFDEQGRIEDVEVLLKFSDIDSPAGNNIKAALDMMFSKYKVQRVQLQWTGPPEALRVLASGGQTALSFATRFELVVKGKKGNKTALCELLFDDHGNLLETQDIIPRNTDILDY